MNCFQTVKYALDDLYTEIREEYGYNTDKLLKNGFTYLHNEYETLRNTGSCSIDHSSKFTHFAYLFLYTAAHANLLFQVLRDARNIRPLNECFNSEKLDVACLGGGPGSDILGVLKYVNQENSSTASLKTVNFTTLDKEQAWEKTSRNIHSKINTSSRFPTLHNFLQVDFTKIESSKFIEKIPNTTLFTMMHSFSEIHGSRKDTYNFFKCLFAEAKPGALFILIDNSNHLLYDWFDDLADSNEIKTLRKSTVYELREAPDERKAVLNEYRYKFDERPHLRPKVFYRIYYKKSATD